MAEIAFTRRTALSPQPAGAAQLKATAIFGAQLASRPLANCLIPRPNEGLGEAISCQLLALSQKRAGPSAAPS
jgi:hypothetical protein